RRLPQRADLEVRRARHEQVIGEPVRGNLRRCQRIGRRRVAGGQQRRHPQRQVGRGDDAGTERGGREHPFARPQQPAQREQRREGQRRFLRGQREQGGGRGG